MDPVAQSLTLVLTVLTALTTPLLALAQRWPRVGAGDTAAA